MSRFPLSHFPPCRAPGLCPLAVGLLFVGAVACADGPVDGPGGLVEDGAVASVDGSPVQLEDLFVEGIGRLIHVRDSMRAAAPPRLLPPGIERPDPLVALQAGGLRVQLEAEGLAQGVDDAIVERVAARLGLPLREGLTRCVPGERAVVLYAATLERLDAGGARLRVERSEGHERGTGWFFTPVELGADGRALGGTELLRGFHAHSGCD